ncbi:unnamed protein product [Penicillium bialowiezense]
MAENEYRSPVVESPVVGADEARPGYWAHLALQSPWDRGRRVRERPGTLLHALKSRPLCREPGKQCSFISRPPNSETAPNEPNLPTTLSSPPTLADIEKELDKEIKARDATIMVVRQHERRIKELGAIKDTLQSS